MASTRSEEGKGAASASASIRLVGSLHPAVRPPHLPPPLSRLIVAVSAAHHSSPLLPQGISPRCEELFDKLNYGPLDKFFKEARRRAHLAIPGALRCKPRPDPDTRRRRAGPAQDGGREAFEHYADIVVQEFTGVLQARARAPLSRCFPKRHRRRP